MRELVLASSSPYRAALLEKLGLPFITSAPYINEARIGAESAPQLAERLALEKAFALAQDHPDALIIGSDQVAELDGTQLTKPGSFDRAVDQLQRCSGRGVIFHTGLCLLDPRSGTHQKAVEPFEVAFRELEPDEIENYLRREEPYDCAGSFKCEGLGITLFRGLNGRDFNSLIGLPLIRLCEMLRVKGVNPLLPEA
ncbi:Maf family protein [Biformimicrobium ophioploci]|uniref:7-methyl-GTP pyrophosphatase n=1 Tax=Biformimicrobium ophioploci TaxID=3036711 RepID=A0ABQ6M203_9GAMM|nr:nucleoside triphosphate pyrophosphatase [Microbulbifer sp. NKW57]GMG88295.1 nucleoside triphosphate pyrophosphatase [Microbulbifer sp. NKW57]